MIVKYCHHKGKDVSKSSFSPGKSDSNLSGNRKKYPDKYWNNEMISQIFILSRQKWLQPFR